MASVAKPVVERTTLVPQHPTPPWPPCALLRLSRSGPGLRTLRVLLDSLGSLWGLLLRRGGELAHGDGLLRDYLLLAAHLVPEKLDLTLETGYERPAVGVCPRVLYIVYPAGIPFVQVDEHPPVRGLVVA